MNSKNDIISTNTIGKYIRLEYDEKESVKYKNGVRRWKCWLGSVRVGNITYDTNKSYTKGKFYHAKVFECEDPSRYGYDSRRADYVGSYKTLYAAKVGMLEKAKQFVQYLAGEKTHKAPVAYLPAADFEFYPTPSDIAGRLFEAVDWNRVKTMLEPSAGKGDLIEFAKQRKRSYRHKGEYYYDRDTGLDCDCIEIDTNLQAILTSKGFRVVHDDFLSYVTRKRYDLILMNPPFSEGDLHLLRAIDMCQNGGQIACILNAETIRNPYTNSRRLLVRRLKELGATVRYIDNAFSKAQRRAKVDIALINISIPYTFADDSIWENLQKARAAENVDAGQQENSIAPSDNVERLIREHDIMCEAGISLMRCYNGIAPHLRPHADSVYPLIMLSMDRDNSIEKCGVEHINKFLRMVRAHYWQQLFDLPDLRDRMTSDMQEQYGNLIDKMRDYEFSKFNIRQVIEKIMGQLQVGVEQAIVDCFDKLSAEHTYSHDVENGNVHYFNGWKTNKAHYVNMKCIIPTWGTFATQYRQNGRGGYSNVMTTISPHGCFSVLGDLEKALNYLDKGETISVNLMEVLNAAKIADRSSNIRCKYFDVTFYKRGTCHIKFHDRKIVDRLNIYVGRNKSWLPPSYGKVRYDEMDEESRRVVDEFQGREAYEQIMKNVDDYLIDAQPMPLLTA